MVDIFSIDSTNYNDGQIINGIDNLSWVEKFRLGGQFEITGRATTSFQEQLALGTMLSHPSTLEIMMVENHLLEENEDGPSNLKVTGRSVQEIIMEKRVAVMSNITGFNPIYTNLTLYPFDYTLTADYGWNHIYNLLLYTLGASYLAPGYALMGLPEELPNFQPVSFVVPSSYPVGLVPDQVERTVRRLATVAEVVKPILDEIDAGIKSERPSPGESHLEFIIHRGFDKRADIIFDHLSGDLVNPRYLWSNKDEINSAYIATSDAGLRLRPTGVTGWDLRVLGIDESDWTAPGGWGIPKQQNIVARARSVASRHRSVTLLDTEISPTTRFRYNEDYQIGDIVMVRGKYGVEAPMRVVEHAIIQDKTGHSEIPTLDLALDPGEIFYTPVA